MPETIASIELEEFVRKVVSDIENGIGEGRTIAKTIQFEISVSKVTRLDGGIKIYVASGGTTTSTEHLSKIKFEVYPTDKRIRSTPVIKSDSSLVDCR